MLIICSDGTVNTHVVNVTDYRNSMEKLRTHQEFIFLDVYTWGVRMGSRIYCCETPSK